MQAALLLETLRPHLPPAKPRAPKVALRGGFGVAVAFAPAASAVPAAPAAPAAPTATAATTAPAVLATLAMPAAPAASSQDVGVGDSVPAGSHLVE